MVVTTLETAKSFLARNQPFPPDAEWTQEMFECLDPALDILDNDIDDEARRLLFGALNDGTCYERRERMLGLVAQGGKELVESLALQAFRHGYDTTQADKAADLLGGYASLIPFDSSVPKLSHETTEKICAMLQLEGPYRPQAASALGMMADATYRAWLEETLESARGRDEELRVLCKEILERMRERELRHSQ